MFTGRLGLWLPPPKPADKSQKPLGNLSPYSPPILTNPLAGWQVTPFLKCPRYHAGLASHPPSHSSTGPPSSSPHFDSLPPLPSTFRTVARGNEGDEIQIKPQTRHLVLTLAHPSTSFYHAPAVLATLLTPNSFLPQHPCTCCFSVRKTFPLSHSQGWHLCAIPVSADVSLPQWNSPQHPLSSLPQPPPPSRCVSLTFCCDDSIALFIPT